MRGRRPTDGEADNGWAPSLLHAGPFERVVQRREDKLKREDNQAASRNPGSGLRRLLRGELVSGTGPCPIRAHLSNQLGSAGAASAAATATSAIAELAATAAPAPSSRIWASARKVMVPASSSIAEGGARLARSAGRERSEAAWKPSVGAHATRAIMSPLLGVCGRSSESSEMVGGRGGCGRLPGVVSCGVCFFPLLSLLSFLFFPFCSFFSFFSPARAWE